MSRFDFRVYCIYSVPCLEASYCHEERFTLRLLMCFWGLVLCLGGKDGRKYLIALSHEAALLQSRVHSHDIIDHPHDICI